MWALLLAVHLYSSLAKYSLGSLTQPRTVCVHLIMTFTTVFLQAFTIYFVQLVKTTEKASESYLKAAYFKDRRQFSQGTVLKLWAFRHFSSRLTISAQPMTFRQSHLVQTVFSEFVEAFQWDAELWLYLHCLMALSISVIHLWCCRSLCLVGKPQENTVPAVFVHVWCKIHN